MQNIIKYIIKNDVNPDFKNNFYKKCFLEEMKIKKTSKLNRSISVNGIQFPTSQVLNVSKQYLDLYATSEEKAKYYELTSEYVEKIVPNNLQLQKLYIISKQIYETFFQFGLISTEFLSLTRKFKLSINKLLEYLCLYDNFFASLYERRKFPFHDLSSITKLEQYFCYQIAVKYDWNYSKISNFLPKIGKGMRDFVVNINNISNISNQEKVINFLNTYNLIENFKSRYALIIKELLEPSKTSDLSKLNTNNIKELELNLTKYVILYIKFVLKKEVNKNLVLEVANSLQEQLNLKKQMINSEYQRRILLYHEEQRKIKLELIRNLLKDIDDYEEFSEEEFCNKKNISQGSLKNLIAILKTSDYDLYQVYQSKILNRKKREIKEVLTIIDLIKNGVFENEEFREFDVLDYFLLTDLSFNKALLIAKANTSHEDYMYLRSFCYKKGKETPITLDTIKDILNTTQTLKLEDGDYVVPREEKEEILNYLKELFQNRENKLTYSCYLAFLNRKYKNKLLKKK